MLNVQEESTEKAIKFLFSVTKLSGRVLATGLRIMLDKLMNKEPIGKQRLDTLMRGGQEMSASEVIAATAKELAADMKVFDRLARKHGVGYSVVKQEEGLGYTVLFRAKSKEPYEKLLNEFAKHTMKGMDNTKEPLAERIEKAKNIAESRNAERQAEQLISQEKSARKSARERMK